MSKCAYISRTDREKILKHLSFIKKSILSNVMGENLVLGLLPLHTGACASMESITNNRGFKPSESKMLTRKYFWKNSCDITGGSEDDFIPFLTI